MPGWSACSSWSCTMALSSLSTRDWMSCSGGGVSLISCISPIFLKCFFSFSLQEPAQLKLALHHLNSKGSARSRRAELRELSKAFSKLSNLNVSRDASSSGVWRVGELIRLEKALPCWSWDGIVLKGAWSISRVFSGRVHEPGLFLVWVAQIRGPCKGRRPKDSASMRLFQPLGSWVTWHLAPKADDENKAKWDFDRELQMREKRDSETSWECAWEEEVS